MAAKRLRDDPDHGRELSESKRVRQLPSFSTVIREATMAKSFQNIVFALEPLLRKAVREEVERGVIHSAPLFQRSTPPPMQIEAAAAESSKLKLKFTNPLSLPIFTGSKIEDINSNPLQLILVDADDNELPLSSLPSSPIRVQLVVLDGDFPSGDGQDWTTAEFQKNIVKERTGKRPLLTGDVNVALQDGNASISNLSFTDNSSWTRSRHFRIGARVTQKGFHGPKIMEAMTEPFTVKDHRGEVYRKHYPPALGDEVWRLERIGKDGAFHKKLLAERINTVQDFLKLLTVDPHRLRGILGVGMSDRMWEGTVVHAKTCTVGDKLYVRRCGPQYSLLLNSICEVEWIVSDTLTYALRDLTKPQQAYVQNLAREAYQNWDKLEDADGLLLPQNVGMHQSEMDSLFWDPVRENEEDHLHGFFQPFYQ